ncbi:hypothetical protein RvY_10370 [Ramazzottius varieornatus]|uniref:Uncharacterized protein n=1 Tax=Ramazzottius varieornatus TaxID=947166 RepID=A0A1D1VKA8_RAMVA|nr:hypothetical protein RvY_10370 [Ramazzottius varieornatus]
MLFYPFPELSSSKRWDFPKAVVFVLCLFGVLWIRNRDSFPCATEAGQRPSVVECKMTSLLLGSMPPLRSSNSSSVLSALSNILPFHTKVPYLAELRKVDRC